MGVATDIQRFAMIPGKEKHLKRFNICGKLNNLKSFSLAKFIKTHNKSFVNREQLERFDPLFQIISPIKSNFFHRI